MNCLSDLEYSFRSKACLSDCMYGARVGLVGLFYYLIVKNLGPLLLSGQEQPFVQ